ncbi:MAG: SUMF1/EgtB/PvdO family nonheme iron enzyme [Armatimonadetes bacterium]|nr:SUMF1/EgtB/PvdO family nonheme iron enzyme [Armatimonadota bacterium]
MRKMPGVIGVICCTLMLAGHIQAQEMKVPDGCSPAPAAKAGDMGYADRAVHEKTGTELVLIPAGTFDMGVGGWRLIGKVTIAKPFYIGKTTVTNQQYKRFLASSKYDGAKDCDPGYDLHVRHLRGKSIMPDGDDYPIVFVSWKNAKAFCRWAGGLDLPTEAEWEYACRAGTTTLYSFGDDPKDVDKYAWTQFNSNASTQPVGQLEPNGWGLHDMHGNVWEWCLDDDRPRDKAAPADGSAYTADESTSYIKGLITKILRGGSWSNTLQYAANSDAHLNAASVIAANDIGFRVVLRLK